MSTDLSMEPNVNVFRDTGNSMVSVTIVNSMRIKLTNDAFVQNLNSTKHLMEHALDPHASQI